MDAWASTTVGRSVGARARPTTMTSGDDDDVPCMTTEEARAMFTVGASSARVAPTRASWTPQTREWDCGLACASFVFGRSASDVAPRHRSMWTIDLAHLCIKMGARRATLATTTIGVDPRLAEETFYADDYLRDVARVNASFARAKREDANSPVRVVRRRVRAETIAMIVNDGAHACVALVDRRELSSLETSDGFEGHYVVVEDANVDAKTFTLVDPAGDARTKGRVVVSWSRFDDARRAFGTDEDLLFVSL